MANRRPDREKGGCVVGTREGCAAVEVSEFLERVKNWGNGTKVVRKQPLILQTVSFVQPEGASGVDSMSTLWGSGM